MNKAHRKKIIYIRYIAPVVALLLTALLGLVPCYTYITPDTGVNSAISLFELMDNSWNTSRAYLFGGGETNEITAGFSVTLMILNSVSVLLFVIGIASAVYAAVCAFIYFRGGCRENKSRVLFITLVPNRVALCVYHALILPMFFIPMLMPLLYREMLMYSVQLAVSPFDMAFAALLIYALTVALIVIGRRYERLEEMDLFTKRQLVQEDGEDGEDASPSDNGEEESVYERMNREEKEEQLERILRMLKESDQKKDGDGE